MTTESHAVDQIAGPSGHRTSLKKEGAVALVEFSRPPANYFSVGLLREIADAFEEAERDDDVRAIVLSSAGRNFCAGADLAGESTHPFELYSQAERLFSIRKPSVVAVQGAAIGGGLGLALAADFRVVTPGSKLSANFVKIGIHPGFASTLMLPRLVGHQMASLLLLTGRRVDGEEALRIGLADVIAEPEDLLDTALSLVTEIADNAPLAVESTRAALKADLAARARSRMSEEGRTQMSLMQTEDFAEGVRAVSERRKGNWKRR